MLKAFTAKKRFSESETKQSIACIIDTISFCHKHHIAHRDLKLENIIFKNAFKWNECVIIDWGDSIYIDDPYRKIDDYVS